MRASVRPRRWPVVVLIPFGLLFAALPASCRRDRPPPPAQPADPYEASRKAMVDVLRAERMGDERALGVMATVPRHEFVPDNVRPLAYEDTPLPIGEDQTISAPHMVAFMTWKLDPQPTDSVLEIGTGSGYQAAVLSPLVKHVYTVEIVESLGKAAEERLKRLGYANVSVRVGDGYRGWPEHAPFDKIIVTCAPRKPPQPLIDQLRDGGLMVIPYGEENAQDLYILRKHGGKIEEEAVLPVRFVPMTGEAEKAGGR
jgi:protein-L-isoaspartate(D-aspartate) O-methyltransferase